MKQAAFHLRNFDPRLCGSSRANKRRPTYRVSNSRGGSIRDGRVLRRLPPARIFARTVAVLFHLPGTVFTFCDTPQFHFVWHSTEDVGCHHSWKLPPWIQDVFSGRVAPADQRMPRKV